MKHLQKKESACHDVTILQHIPATQLDALKITYEFMLEAVNDAIKNKRAAQKQSAQIIRIGKSNLIKHDRKCLKIAAMMRRKYSISEISIRFQCELGSKTNINRLSAHGRALFRDRVITARKNHIIHCYNAGVGVREAARTMPPAIGKCSGSYACKIIKAYKMRQQPALSFPLSIA